MTTTAALLRRVRTIERRLSPKQAPRTYSMVLEEGEPLSEELRKHLTPDDTVYIRRYPKGLLGEHLHSSSGQVMSCWLKGPRGILIPHIVREYGTDTSKV